MKLQLLQQVVTERKMLIESKLSSLNRLGKEFQEYVGIMSKYKGKLIGIRGEFNQPDKLISRAIVIPGSARGGVGRGVYSDSLRFIRGKFGYYLLKSSFSGESYANEVLCSW